MHLVYLLIQEMNAFDLPPVCLITGERQGVVFKPVAFSWYPPWISRFLLLGVLALALVPILPIALFVASVRTKQALGTLPFTEESSRSCASRCSSGGPGTDAAPGLASETPGTGALAGGGGATPA
ncbi:hypothetical protein D7V80_32075 [Corallococcus sp. CA054B]|uniref:hypothetical protein n=1 Tax=Corallococcus sp. CA054B TaxID=2316734 RepID=UPI000EA28B19|nr:hypothetical protein [Corallococcus sp. CA054B]RKG63079.1 hypothetical protein D7V80_32075 [Corallococcus sp. CA054B]